MPDMRRSAVEPLGPAISVRALDHFYGPKRALSSLTFDISAAKFTVLLGLNGAGKTTLFSLLSRLYNHKTGEISVCGFNANTQPSEALRRLGLVFQSRTLDLELTIVQNLLYHAALQGISRKCALTRIDELLLAVGLSDRAKDKVRSLSGGQMRRVEIARALLHRPRILLLDEATVGLDINSRASILAIIRDLISKEGVSVLWATHLIDEVGADDDVLVLHHGRMLSAGTVWEIKTLTGTENISDAFAALIERETLTTGGVEGR